jgi:hypothetical protein
MMCASTVPFSWRGVHALLLVKLIFSFPIMKYVSAEASYVDIREFQCSPAAWYGGNSLQRGPPEAALVVSFVDPAEYRIFTQSRLHTGSPCHMVDPFDYHYYHEFTRIHLNSL